MISAHDVATNFLSRGSNYIGYRNCNFTKFDQKNNFLKGILD